VQKSRIDIDHNPLNLNILKQTNTTTLYHTGFPQQTHFAFLESFNVSWKIYYNDDPWMAPCFADLRTPARMALTQEMPFFYSDLESRTLPRYSLIQPRMATSSTGPSNWQHPDNSVEEGEVFIASVYNALRQSSYWNESLMVITYDEHGGFFDHQPPPTTGVPAPNIIPGDNGFDFSRLGVRVPAVVVSPWIPKGTVVNAATGPTATSQFESTSIMASSNRLFGISATMTARDAWAGTFDYLVSDAARLAEPRTDCPLFHEAELKRLSPAQLALEAAKPLNHHHLDSLDLLCYLSLAAHPICNSASNPASDALVEDVEAHYPHLRASALALKQQDFGDISRHLFATYKQILERDNKTDQF
jgi:phospholipase C